jgi:hypothetical protein
MFGMSHLTERADQVAPGAWMWSRIVDPAIPRERCATMPGGDQDTEVILFEHPWFRGQHMHIFGPDGDKDLNAGLGRELLAGKVSSIVVKGSRPWLFYPKQDFRGTDPEDGWEVGVGVYGVTEHAHRKLKDNKLQSLKPKKLPS